MFDKQKGNGNGNGGARPQDVVPDAKATMKAARTIIQSRVDLPAEERSKLAGVLQVSLATSLDLYSQVKQAHWNVIGPHFIAYHQLFDTIAEHAIDWIDKLAERSATLGGVPQGTVRQSATLTQLPDYTLGAAEGPSHVEALSERLAIYCAKLREAADTIDRDGDIHDLATQDLLIEILRLAEMDLWFLDKHTQRSA